MPTRPHSPARERFDVPPLVHAWTLGRASRREIENEIDNIVVRLSSGPDATLASVIIEEAIALDPGDFADRVTLAYQAIEAAIAMTMHPHIIRWWNGIPGIHDRVDAARDRYMAFNAGRFAAMRRRFGDASLADEAPAASGVGIDGAALVIHALAAAAPGKSMQNARQRPAVRYSSRFGPLPPCFARATFATIANTPTLLISGTAAILGEDTVHLGDLNGQMNTTFDHLNKLVAGVHMSAADVCTVRAYVPPVALASDLRGAMTRAFPLARDIELVSADLCRRELLVEIECIAMRDMRN